MILLKTASIDDPTMEMEDEDEEIVDHERARFFGDAEHELSTPTTGADEAIIMEERML